MGEVSPYAQASFKISKFAQYFMRCFSYSLNQRIKCVHLLLFQVILRYPLEASHKNALKKFLSYLWGSAPRPAKEPKRVKLSVLRVDGSMRLDLRNRTQACVSAAQIVVGIVELSP